MPPHRLILPLIAIACAVPVQAGDVRPINLPAGELRHAVATLGRQAGVSVSVPDRGVWRTRVRAVRGKMTARQALDRMLGGTAARAVALDARSWKIVRATVRPAPAPVAPPVATADAGPGEDAGAGEDIIVVASKRAVPLSGYAGQVSRVEGEDFAIGAAPGTEAIGSRVASVTSTHFGSGRNKLFVRGIADSSFTGPTQATVGQYFGDVRLTYNAPDPGLKLMDIAAVEVLEGPQGTLYGAGSLGGIIRVTRNVPQLEITGAEVVGGVSATQGGEPGRDMGAVLNVPLIEGVVALRAVGYGSREGGYIDDGLRGLADINRLETYGGRVSVRIAPGNGWSIDLGATVQDIDGADSQYADLGAGLSRASSIAQPYSDAYRLGEIVVAKEWDDLRFVSSTGIVRQEIAERFDATTDPAVPRAFDQMNRVDLISMENRLARPMARGFGWIVGMSLLRNESELTRAIGPVGRPRPATGVRNRIDEATVYAEASVEPVAGLTISGGGRVTHSRLSGEGLDVQRALSAIERFAVQGDRSETTVLPSVAVVAEPIDGLSVYARYQEGFRPGGLAVSDDFVRRFANDEVKSLETGVRFGIPGVDAFTIAGTFAHTRWNDIQADFVDGQGLPTTANIGNGRIYSWDVRLGWRPLPGLSIDAGFVINDGEITDPQPAFRLATLSELPNVAEMGGRLGFDYRTFLSDDVDLRVNGWARYIGRSRLGVGPILGGPQGDYVDTALTARAGWQRFGVTLGVTNLLDSRGNRFSLGSPFDLFRGDATTPLRPRTVRIGVDTRF